MLVKSYTEEGYQQIPPVRLSDEEYAKALQCFVPVCTDIVPIDRALQLIYLAKRKTKPMVGWWWTGGRMMPHETKEEAAIRCFQRETKLSLDQRRLELVAVLDYRCKNRSQTPDAIGCHMLGITFTVELTPNELSSASANLEKNEYEDGGGLVAFNRADLFEERVASPIIDLYNQVFPPKKLFCC